MKKVYKEVVINACYGGFGISKRCAELMAELGCEQAKEELKEWEKQKKKIDYFLKHKKFPKGTGSMEGGFLAIDAKFKEEPSFHGCGYTKKYPEGYSRENKYLIAAIKKLKAKANGQCANLKIVLIPWEVIYEVKEYDGYEHIAEAHRTWS